jgi:hypothetical protein
VRSILEPLLGVCLGQWLESTAREAADSVRQQSPCVFQVYDAMTFSSEPLARIPLPQRVPNGLHGVFVNRDQLSKQVLLAERHAEALV